MDRKSLVATVIIAILVLSLIITPSLVVRTSSKVGLNLRDEVRNHVTVTLKVYKNGELVYKNDDDPITDTWIKAVISTMFQLYRYGLRFTYTDGSTGSWVKNDVVYSSKRVKGVLAIGTDTSPASTTDIALYAPYMEHVLDSSNYLIQDNANWVNVTISHTFIVSESVSIAEAGLMIKDMSGKYILVCRDSFTPVSLNADEGLTIEYRFNIKKDPPFTEYFWGVIINVFLGYEGSSGSAWRGHVFYTENSGHAEDNPYNENKVRWAIVLSDDPWSTTSIINLDMSKVSWTVGNQSFNLHIRLDEYDQNTYEAYGLAFYVYVCTSKNSYNWSQYSTKLIAYIRYPNPPVTVDRYTYHIIDLGVNFNA